MEAKPVERSGMKASLGLFDATAISVGAIVGAGIYVVIGIAAGLAGPAVIVSMLIAAVISTLTALSYAELTSFMPREGGVYEFAHELLSPFVGFVTGWMWLVSNIFTGAAVSLGFAYYLKAAGIGVDVKLLAAATCLAFTVLNYFGVKHSATVNNVLVVAKVLILCFFVVFGLAFMHPQNLSPFVHSGKGVLYATVYVFFAFGGFGRVAVVAEEVRDPRKTVPRAIVLSLLISTLLYVSVGLVAIGLVGAAGLGSSGSPLTDAIDSTHNQLAFYLVSAGGLLATASVLLTSVLGVSRVMYSMARRDELPGVLSVVSRATGTPHLSVWASGLLMIVLVLLIDLEKVVVVSTFALLFYYAVANASALRLGKAARTYPRAVPVAGLATCALLLAFVLSASPKGWAIGVASLAAGAVFFWAWTRRKK